MKYKFYFITASMIVLFLAALPAFADYKIKQRTTMSGQQIESTILVKGSRKRTESGGYMGMGADVATVEQCDMKRSVTINDGKKLYFIESFADSSNDASNNNSAATNANSPVTKGGTVTMTYNVTDTGERKTMFGLTARHLKTVMTMQASPDACSKNDMRIETDGWYIDLPQFACPLQAPQNPMARGARGGCQDRMIVKQTGAGKIGFPLTLTQTIGSGETTFTQTIETLEFSNATLDAALFDVPKNYQLAKSSQDLYGKPDMSQMMSGMNNGGNGEDSTASTKSNSVSSSAKPAAKKAGTIRIGVLLPSNKTSETISPESLRSLITSKLTSGNTEAIALNSQSDAAAMQCDYVLAIDVSKLKQSAAGKLGGFLGKATGVDASGTQKFEAQIDYKLMTPDGQIAAQNKVVQKTEGNAETAAETALSQAAPTIISAAGKKN